MFNLIKKLFKKSQPLYRSGWGTGVSFIDQTRGISIDGVPLIVNNIPSKKPEVKRINRKPVEIFKEIISLEPKIDLTDLDFKIKTVERRRRLLKEELEMNPQDEEEALIYLYARKKLLKIKHNFQWEMTNEKLITSLCQKYNVANVPFSGYFKTIPMEAITELEKYLKEHKKFTDVKPILRLIIDDAPTEDSRDSRSGERKKDPILLASSPFGRWYFILGAWDKEVAIVDDLIYKNK